MDMRLSVSTWICLAVCFGVSVPKIFAEPISTKTFLAAVGERASRVEEFRFLKSQADALGVRVYLFGGTAAAFAHYVKWDLKSESGDKRYQRDRFDFDYTNIFRSTQDLDIVVDGSLENIEKLEKLVREKFPHSQGSKSIWEIRSLTEKRGDKEPLLNNPDFLNQNTDTHSTGLIELTKPKRGEPLIRDLMDWNNKSPRFLSDVLEDKIHYYSSAKHLSTSRAKEGLNPPILSVIRFLTKAFQFELEIRPDDLVTIKKIIRDFDPRRDINNYYLRNWIEKNGKKLFQHAVNLTFANQVLEETGLKEKLKSWGDSTEKDSLAWWINRKPLRSSKVGQGTGKTAAQLGIMVVAHETSDFLAYESITRAHTGEPNVFTSREGTIGEAAAFGEGFYTKLGREGAKGTGITIRFEVDPNAREGTDFEFKPGSDFVIFKNKNAFRVIPESLNLTPVGFFELLAEGGFSDHADKGVVEKLRRRAGAKLYSDAETLKAIEGIVEKAMKKGNANGNLIHAWLALPDSAKSPKMILDALKSSTSPLVYRKLISESILDQPHWQKIDGVSDAIVQTVREVLPKLKDEIQWLGFLVKWFQSPESVKYPELLSEIRRILPPNSVVIGSLSNAMAFTLHWAERPETAELLLSQLRGKYVKPMMYNELMRGLANNVSWRKNKDYFELSLELLRNHDALEYTAANELFALPYWRTHEKRDEMFSEIARSISVVRPLLFQWLRDPNMKESKVAAEYLAKQISLSENQDKDGWFYQNIADIRSLPHWRGNPLLKAALKPDRCKYRRLASEYD